MQSSFSNSIVVKSSQTPIEDVIRNTPLLHQLLLAASDGKTKEEITEYHKSIHTSFEHSIKFCAQKDRSKILIYTLVNRSRFTMLDKTSEREQRFTFKWSPEMRAAAEGHTTQWGIDCFFNTKTGRRLAIHSGLNVPMIAKVLITSIETFPGYLKTLELYKDCAEWLNPVIFHPDLERRCDTLVFKDPSDENQVERLLKHFNIKTTVDYIRPFNDETPTQRKILVIDAQKSFIQDLLTPRYLHNLECGVAEGIEEFLDTIPVEKQFILASVFPCTKPVIANFHKMGYYKITHDVVFSIEYTNTGREIKHFTFSVQKNYKDTFSWTFKQTASLENAKSWWLGDIELLGIEKIGNQFVHADYNITMIEKVLTFCADLFPGKFGKIVLIDDTCGFLRPYFSHHNMSRRCEELSVIDPSDKRDFAWLVGKLKPNNFKLKTNTEIDLRKVVKAEMCQLYGAKWITTEHLVLGKYRKLFVVSKKIGTDNLIEFIEDWQGRTSRRIQWFGLKNKCVDFKQLCSQLQFKDRTRTLRYDLNLSEFIDGFADRTLYSDDAMEFIRDDGVPAVLVKTQDVIWFIVQPDKSSAKRSHERYEDIEDDSDEEPIKRMRS
ncbi:unnamed protein product [Caenorhabditis sp. 36 PRJEB53466]|nr:unnamed protein product [Caenorhabditis sp. 36 PRJEB53466]